MDEIGDTLVPVEERRVDFYGDEIVAALVEIDQETRVYVPIRPICEYLGLSWSGQRERINRDLVLSQEVRFVHVTRTAHGGNPNLFCLPIELLNGWLFGIAPNRVKAEVSSKLIQYQKMCFQVLWHIFQGDLNYVESPLTYMTRLSEIEKLPQSIIPTPSRQSLVEGVYRQCIRAERMGLPATLTVDQWMLTLKAFDEKCAYWCKKSWVIIEHFVPISLGGGTTIGNCVPSCYACNSSKGYNHPSEVTTFSRQVLDAIAAKLAYLSSSFNSAL